VIFTRDWLLCIHSNHTVSDEDLIILVRKTVPNHLVTADIVDRMPEEVRQRRNQLEGRSMFVKRAKVIPLEFVVRGYLTDERGSTTRLWHSHRKAQHG